MSGQSKQQRRAQARAQREAAERAAAQSDQRRKRLLQLGGVLAAAAVIVVAVILIAGGGSGDKTAASGSSTVANTAAIQEQLSGIPQDGLTLGDPDAPITIVEYADLQCPACASFSNTVLPGVVNDYVRTGKARIQFRNFPFLGDDSDRMARMAVAVAQQNKMYDFNELVYANQGQENSGYATDAYLRKIASAVPGLDVDKAMDERDSQAVTEQLAQDLSLATAAGVDSTPTVLVGRSGQTPTAINAGDLPAKLAELSS